MAMQELAGKPTDRGREMFERARKRIDSLVTKVLDADYLSEATTTAPEDNDVQEAMFLTFDCDLAARGARCSSSGTRLPSLRHSYDDSELKLT